MYTNSNVKTRYAMDRIAIPSIRSIIKTCNEFLKKIFLYFFDEMRKKPDNMLL